MGVATSNASPATQRPRAHLLPRMSLGQVALGGFGALASLWLVAPIIVIVPLSFTDQPSFKFPPTGFSTQWYSNLFTNPQWRDSLFHSLEIAGLVIVLASVLGTACALGLDRSQLRGKALLRALILSPMIVPIVIVAVGVYAVFLPWHLVGNELGFVLAHTCLALPFVVVAVSTSLSNFDRRLENAAASLGASPLTTFLHVTLPLIAPGIFVGAVLAFITSFDEVVTALFLSTPTMRTIPVQMFDSVQNIDPTIAAASTLVLAATTLAVLLAVLVNHDFREGSTRAPTADPPPVAAAPTAP
jgi:putative spermidine/putrescine transport system permease protein